MQIAESIAARGRPKGCYEWALVRPGRDYGIYHCSGGCYDVMNGHGLVRPGRLQNLSPLGGTRGDVMNGHWCDQAEIMKSIAARGRPRGCNEWVVRPGRDYEIYRCSGAPEGTL